MTDTTAIVHAGMGQVELRDTQVRPPGPGELLIRTEVSCVSPGTELRGLAGLLSDVPSFPFVPGESLVGRVIATGEGVVIGPGTRVHVTGTIAAEGLNVCRGGHVGLAVASADRAIVVPNDVAPETAAVARLAAVAHHGWRVANPRPGATVAVVGLGAIGLCAAVVHQARGSQVVAVDAAAARVEVARQMKLDAVRVQTTIAAAVHKRFPHGTELIVDATGLADVFPQAIEALAPLPWDQSTHPPRLYVVQGSPAEPTSIPYGPAFERELQVCFPRDHQRSDYIGALELALRKQIDLTPLTASVRRPAEASQVYAALRDPTTAPPTVLFDWR